MTPSRDDRIAELCVRHHLGHYRHQPNVHDRLALIFERNPADALERLERACDHLDVTGAYLEALANHAVARLAATQPAELDSAQLALPTEGRA